MSLGDVLAEKTGDMASTLGLWNALPAGTQPHKVLPNHDWFALLNVFALVHPNAPLSQAIKQKFRYRGNTSYQSLQLSLNRLGKTDADAAKTLWEDMKPYFKDMQLVHWHPLTNQQAVLGLHNAAATTTVDDLLKGFGHEQGTQGFSSIEACVTALNAGWEEIKTGLFEGRGCDAALTKALMRFVSKDPFFLIRQASRKSKNNHTPTHFSDEHLLRWVGPFQEAKLHTLVHGHCLQPYATTTTQNTQVVGLNNHFGLPNPEKGMGYDPILLINA